MSARAQRLRAFQLRRERTLSKLLAPHLTEPLRAALGKRRGVDYRRGAGRDAEHRADRDRTAVDLILASLDRGDHFGRHMADELYERPGAHHARRDGKVRSHGALRAGHRHPQTVLTSAREMRGRPFTDAHERPIDCWRKEETISVRLSQIRRPRSRTVRDLPLAGATCRESGSPATQSRLVEHGAVAIATRAPRRARHRRSHYGRLVEHLITYEPGPTGTA
jgi:hypothetical protein